MRALLYYSGIVLLLLITIGVQAQPDKIYWFAAPDVSDVHGDGPAIFRISTYETGANVSIFIPAENNRILSQFKVNPYSQYKIELDPFTVENSPANNINNKGICIVSDAEVSVYYEVSNPDNAEKFILKGDNSLGKWFFIPSQIAYGNYQTNRSTASEKADIVATEDQTSIEIIPSVDITGHQANIPFDIVLNKGQTYCIECADISAEGALAGTEIRANKRIAVTISDDAVMEDPGSNPNDLIGDQLIPVNALGQEYVAINTSKAPSSFKNTNTVQKVFVLAIEDNTMVFLNNTSKTAKLLQKGETAEFDFSDHAAFIYATKRVYAYQLTGLVNNSESAANELGSAILPRYYCNGSSRVSVTRVFDRDFWVNIVVKRKDIKSFVFKDSQGYELSLKKYMNSWQTVPGQLTGQDSWVCCAANLNDLTTGTPYFIENTSGVFHLCVLDENGLNEESGCSSFGYLSSYNSFWVDGQQEACRGNVIPLTAKGGFSNYKWYSDISGSEVLSTSPELAVTESGKYYVDAINDEGCIFSDTIDVNFMLPEVELGNDTTICQGENLGYQLGNNYSSYSWSNGASGSSTQVNTQNAGSFMLGVEVADEYGCTNNDSVLITVSEVPEIKINKTEVCEGGLVVCESVFERYEWRFGGELINQNAAQSWIKPEESGEYSISGWTDDGCVVSSVVNLSVHPLPQFEFKNQFACQGDTVVIDAPNSFETYLWSDGSSLPQLELNDDANYWLEVTDENGCVYRNGASITFYKPLALDLGPDREECEGVLIHIAADSAYSNYNWFFKLDGDVASQEMPNKDSDYRIERAGVNHSGLYRLEAMDKNGCMVHDEVNLNIMPSDSLTLSVTQNLCEGQTVDLKVSAGYENYVWYKDDELLSEYENRNQILNIENAGVYRVEASSGVCMQATEIVVISHAIPEVQLEADVSLCGDETKEISINSYHSSSGADLDYLFWNEKEDVRFSNWQTSYLEVSQSGIYKVTVVDEFGCRAMDTMYVSQYMPEIVELGPDINRCEGEQVRIENPVLDAISYNWYLLSDTDREIVTQNNPIEILQPGIYELEIIDAHGCLSSDQVLVHFNSNPSVRIVGENEACGSTLLEVVSDLDDVDVVWNHTPGMNSAQIKVNSSGTYSVVVTDANGCSSLDSVSLLIHDIPQVNLTDLSACEGDTIWTSGPDGFITYEWSNGSTSKDIQILNSGNYELTVTDQNGCSGTNDMQVSFIRPVPLELGPDRDECEGSLVEIRANSQHTAYQWYFLPKASPDLKSTLLSNATQSYRIENGLIANSGIYSLEAQDENGCLVRDEVLVSFYEVSPETSTMTEYICMGDTFNVSGPEGYDTYTWYIDGTVTDSTFDVSQLEGITKEGVYRVEASLGACVKTNNIEVVRQVSPTVTLADLVWLCPGGQVDVTVENFYSNNSQLDYLYWNDNTQERINDWQTAKLEVGEAGEYSVTAVDEFGCMANDTIEVLKSLVPDLVVNESEACPHQELTFSIDDRFASYAWSNGDNDYTTVVNTGNEEYIQLEVEVLDNKGCAIKDTIGITVFNNPQIELSQTVVCEGSYIENMTSFERYEWMFNDTVLNIKESQNWIIPKKSGDYKVMAWTASGCAVTKDFSVTVHALPQMSLDNKQACEGDTIQIKAPLGFETYQWSTGENSDAIYLNSDTNYWLQVTDKYGCAGRAEASATFIQPMEIDLGPDRNECVGIDVNLQANALYSAHEWYFEPLEHKDEVQYLNQPGSSFQILNGSKSNSGLYTVEALDVNGCAVKDEVLVKFYQVNPPQLKMEEHLCPAEDIVISATEGYDSYTWYYNEQPISTANNQPDLRGINTPGLYKVEVTSGKCSNSKEIEVVQHQAPSVRLSDDFSLCKKENGVISINKYFSEENAVLSYYFWSNNPQIRLRDWQSSGLSVFQAGTYGVTVVDENGCSASDEVLVTNYPDLKLDLGDPISICPGTSVHIESPVDSSNQWIWFSRLLSSDQVLTNNSDLEISDGGEYIIKVEDIYGCTTQDTLIVNMLKEPQVHIEGNTFACGQTSLYLNADGENYTYRWNDSPELNTYSLNVSNSGTFKVDIWDENGCHNSDQAEVQIYPLPKLDLLNDTVCAGQKGMLSAPSGEYNYLWSNGEKTSSISVWDGNYTLKLTDKFGCEIEGKASVIWRSLPKVDLGPDLVICPLEERQLDAGSDYSSYQWHNGSSSETIIASLLDTVNQVFVTDKYGCTGFDTQTTKFKVAPEIDLCSDTSVCKHQITILNAGAGFDEYLWNDGDQNQIKEISEPGMYWINVSDGCFLFSDTARIAHWDMPVVAVLDTSLYAQIVVRGVGGTEPYRYALDQGLPQNTNVFKDLKNGYHEIEIIDQNGCNAFANITLSNVYDIDIPEFFTPNYDGINDTWVVEGIERFTDSVIKIFDRYGKLLAKFYASERGWDGTYLNKPMPTDDYWYVIEGLPAGKTLKGHITLKRE